MCPCGLLGCNKCPTLLGDTDVKLKMNSETGNPILSEARRPERGALTSQISSVQSLSRVRLFATPWTAASQASLSFINTWSLLKLMSIELVMPSNHLILCHPRLLLPSQSFPTSGSFPMSQFFTSGGQSIGASALASVPPMNIQDCFRLGWTDLISLGIQGTLKSLL